MSSINLGENTSLPAGTRDAVHCPIVIVSSKEYPVKLSPGDWVKFTDDKFTKVEKCEKRDADGIVDPFLETVDCYENFAIMLVPHTTQGLFHSFDINPAYRKAYQKSLQLELEDVRQNDPDCGDCWAIKNGKIIRY